MASNVSISTKFLTLFLITTLFQSSHVASQIGVYWGQNEREGSLKDACDADVNYATFSIAFLSTFGSGQTPKLDILSNCNPNNGECEYLGSEIKGCQAGKGPFRQRFVYLSIGGNTGNGYYNLSSAEDAKEVATYIWNNFLGGDSQSRPFGDAVLDGVEFNIQEPGSEYYWDVLAQELRTYSERLLLAASPSCTYPDNYLNTAVHSGAFNEFWVRYYNDSNCQYNGEGKVDKLMASWTKWSNLGFEVEANVCLNLVASSSAASGYISLNVLNTEVIPKLLYDLNFGGVKVWDTYYDQYTGYSSKIVPFEGLNLPKSTFSIVDDA